MRAFPIAAVAIAIYAPAAVAAVEDDLRDGDKYFEDKDYKKAAAAYDRAIAKAPGQVAAEAYGKRAAIFTILKDYNGGLAFIERAKQRYPNAPEVLEQEALMLSELNRKDEAVKIAEQVVKARPQSFLNQKLIGDYYVERDTLKTVAAFEAYLQYRPGELESVDVVPRIQLGRSYLKNARSVLADGDEARAKQYYDKGREQFEIVKRKHAKKAGAVTNADNGLCAAYVGLARWDQAISVCEQIIQDTRKIDSSGSVYFNLSTALLARKQTRKARAAASEFTRVRKNEARGFMLIGDTFFEENDWPAALDQYLRAERALKPNQSREQGMLAIRLGKTYRRLPSTGGANTNLNLAIEKLSVAATANPNNAELAVELGGAYLVAKQDAKALALSEKWIAGSEFPKLAAEQRGALLMIAGKSFFNQKKLTESRQRFEAARQIRPTDVQIQKALVLSINEQAFAELVRKDYKQADGLLGEALKIDKDSPTTLTNLAVLSLERGDCDNAKKQLFALDKVNGRDAVLTQRLLARSWLCSNPANRVKAAEAYGNAEREAKKANAAALAEIYTEWAPLVWDSNIADAVEKLEAAVAAASQDPDIAPAAKRNLALALYRRGWKSMRDGKAGEAAADFERATRDPSVLKGTEPLAFEFSLALAYLDSRPGESAKIFRTLGGKGNQGGYLKGAYASIGTQFFTAYANYKSTSGVARQQACQELAKSANQLGGKSKELVAACYESVAYDHFRAGNWGAAQKAISDAEKTASAEQSRRLRNNSTVMSLSKSSANVLEALGGNPAESLVNLGIVYDMMGKPKEAFDAWSRAKARGLQQRDQATVQKWIDAKKRIYGY